MGGRDGWDGVVSSAGSRGRQRRDGVAVAAQRGGSDGRGRAARREGTGLGWMGRKGAGRGGGGRTREETVGSLPAV